MNDEAKNAAAFRLAHQLKELVENANREEFERELQAADQHVALMALSYLMASHYHWLYDHGPRLDFYITNMNWSQ